MYFCGRNAEEPHLTKAKMKVRNSLGFAHLIKMVAHRWQWFLLSVVICLCAALLYVHYVTPVYKISGRLMIHQSDNYGHRGSTRMLRYVSNLGEVKRTEGVDNEIEMLWSSTLMHDVVMSLKLYADYRVKEGRKKRQVYATQPVSADLDRFHLDSIDKIAYEDYCSIDMLLKRKSEQDSTILLKGVLDCNDESVWTFQRQIKTLPEVIETPFGTLTLTKNPNGEPLTAGQEWLICIEPPLATALDCLGRLGVTKLEKESDSYRWLRSYFLKMSSIVELTYVDHLKRRGLDIINQIAISYNRRANDDKNEIALRTEAFINERIARLSKELGQTDESIKEIKQQGDLTNLADGARSIAQADRFGSELTEAQAQGMMLDYLGEYISKPENKYEIIPSNMGMRNSVSEEMIGKYNEIVQERKRLLRSASEESPQVKTLTAEADEMSAAIQAALQQAKHLTATEQERLMSQYSNFRGKVFDTPVAEKALTDAGRQQYVRNRLFKLLLQRREENSIALSSTSNHGKLIDEPMVEGQIRPNLWKAFCIALGVGICCPFAIFFLLGFFRYKIENLKDLEEMTERPIIAEVPLAGDDVKGKAGIVIRSGVNEPITEAFRMMRTNIHFMLKGEGNTILFTSSTSGEGKSFCAANLAMSCALLGKRVILCGMDLRRPALGQLFALEESGKGLTILLGMEEITEADVCNQIVPSGIDQNLDLLQAGPIPPNPTELLARESFGQVMAILKKMYDYVILDTAPVGLVTDSLPIGCYADMTIFVCRAEFTPNYAVAQLNQLSIENRLPNTCFILNGLGTKPHKI